MEKCKNCDCYDDKDSYKGTGFCVLVGDLRRKIELLIS